MSQRVGIPWSRLHFHHKSSRVTGKSILLSAEYDWRLHFWKKVL